MSGQTVSQQSLITEKNMTEQKSVFELVQIIRAGILTLILSVSLGSYLVQSNFVNWSFLGSFYGILLFAYLLQFVWQWIIQFKSDSNFLLKLYFVGFVLDSILLSGLIYYTGVNQSLFLFLHLVNILLAGLVTGTAGAVVVALVSSITFSFSTLWGPELKPLQSLLVLALNNVAFFSVAGLAGYLSTQLKTMSVELKITGQSLKKVEAYNELLLENVPVGIVSFDKSGEIHSLNPVAENILGSSEVRLFDVLPSIQNSLVDGFRGDIKLQSADGAETRILQSVLKKYAPHFQEQEIWLAVLEDITEVRRLEYSSRQNEKLAAIGGLAAGIAHEIRNPLAGISGSIELLSQTTQNDDDKKLMKIILREIDRLNNLITEFLDYSRPEQPPTDAVNISEVIKEVMSSMSSNKQVRQDIQCEVNISPDIFILGFRDKLKQAFLNIVLNAYQAMQDSTEAKITVGLESNNGTVTLKIKDSGCGMSEQTRKRMFEPFHTTKAKGTGLGLAVTHKILEGHKAQIYVESEKGVGTEFILHFPQAKIQIS